jgi:hypothetical protein
VFDDFTDTIYKIKSNPSNESEKNIAKLTLNSLIGRFGMDYLKGVTRLVDSETHNHISITRNLKNSIEIDDNTYLDTYIPNVDPKVCEKFGVDFIKALNTEDFEEGKHDKSYKSVSISTAAAVISYARIHMAKIMLYILENGGTIYYTDTDSIVCNIKLPDELVDSKELGKLKLEYVIKEGYFIADKVYAFKTVDDKLVKRAKGVDSSSLKYEDYIKLYKMENVESVTRTSSKRNYSEGSVRIIVEKMLLDTSSYSKRNKIFHNGKWVGTSPVTIKGEDLIYNK